MSTTTPTTVSRNLALNGGTPVGEVTYSKFPLFSETAIERVGQVLREGKAIGLGRFHSPEITEAEQTISQYHGGREVLACSSGHAALQGALAGLEICGGDEVITTPYTWGASTSCILHQNAIPVFVDIEPETGLIDPELIEAAITLRTKAILAVHIFGQPANLRRLREIAHKHARRTAPASMACASAKWAMPRGSPAWAARCCPRRKRDIWSRQARTCFGKPR